MSDPTDVPLLPSRVLAERTHLAIPSLPQWIEPTVEYLRQRAILGGICKETRSGKITVALHEAIANAVIHGNLEVSSDLKEQSADAFAEALAQCSTDARLTARQVEILMEYDGDVCQWTITDEGNGFDVDAVLRRCLSDDPQLTLASGRGILMMKSFLDDVRYERGGRRVVLTLYRNSGQEKRRTDRVAMTVPLQVTPLALDGQPDFNASYEVLSRNLSANGIAILQVRLAQTQQILIGIPTEQGVVNVPATVKHSRPFGSGGMELGCQFLPAETPPPSDDPTLQAVQAAVTRFLEKRAARQLPADERRIHPRLAFNERVTIHVDGRSEPIVGYARDLSKGGVALIAQTPVPGEITIAFTASGERELLKVRCRVMRCDCIKEGFYDIGAAFTSLAAAVE